MYILPNILQSKGNQTMKFGQLIIYYKKNKKTKIFFFKIHAENETRKPVPDLLLFFIKALYEVKTKGLQLSSNIFG